MRPFVIVMISLLTLCFSLQTHAYVIVTRHLIFSTPPEPKNCDSVDAHWESDNVWAGPQTICTYEDMPEGTKLLRDYWACNKFTSSGNCLHWKFMPGRWLDKTPEEN